MLGITHQVIKYRKGKQTHSPKLLCSFIIMLNEKLSAIMKLIAVKFCFRIMFINEKSNQYIRMIKYQVFVILAIKYE